MYGQLKNISTQVVKQFGMACTVITQSAGQYNPVTGAVEGGGENKQSAHCIFDNLAYDFPRFQSGGEGKASSSMVKQGDVLIYITAEAKPELSAQIVANGEKWIVITCQPISPAGTALLYQCQARRVYG
ncbi:hypothetical protein FHQ28_05640 [Pasteurellaceae bacterium USgator11]|nr:hypothetical protein FHQ20_07900 [Pasteurellaceae bacterium USgator41]TNG96478.1 hypothetical protein FHQ19_02075 [Pasteurellaceae bacterium UScroc12]TNH00440.1 hypothetical protein FHQ24_03550 [Pasteurellaceae bacterium UScroc31]TNH01729.1 hypothetical protein FHQ28_05640 [Pasteurellaceae bacterium USgator11]